MDISAEESKASRLQEQLQQSEPKRLKLNLSKPQPLAQPVAASSSPSAGLYPPAFAGVNQIHGDIPLSEFSNYTTWIGEVGDVLEADPEIMDEPSWDEYGESPPHLSDEDLAKVDYDSDKFELERLVAMGAVRHPRADEDISTYETLTTKIVRDWRRRPGWTRRSRLVAREFRSWTPWTQELFAPASCLSVVHSFISLALSKGLEITTLDIKDAYLNVKQKAPVIIQVDAELFGDGERGQVPFILERLLPGQHVAASEWFSYMKFFCWEMRLAGLCERAHALPSQRSRK